MTSIFRVEGNIKYCPKCGSDNHEDASQCWYCMEVFGKYEITVTVN